MKFFILIGGFLMLAAGLVHFYWALGGKRLKEHVLPTRQSGEKLFKPSWQGTFAVGLALCAVSSAVLSTIFTERALPSPLFWLCVMFSVIFFFRFIGDTRYVGFFRRERGTAFARYDSLIYTPLSLLFAIACAFAAMYR